MIAPSKLLTATGNFLKRNLGYSNEFLNARAYGKSAGLLPASVRVPTVNDFGAKSITSGCRGLQVKLKASYNRDAFLVIEGRVNQTGGNWSRLPVKSVRPGFDLGRYQTGPNSKFKFEFKKMKNS